MRKVILFHVTLSYTHDVELSETLIQLMWTSIANRS